MDFFLWKFWPPIPFIYLYTEGKSTWCDGMRKNGPWKNGPQKWSPGKMVPRKNGPRIIGPQKIGHRENGPQKMVPRKNGPREKWSPDNWSPEKWSLEKFASKIDLRQKSARKFERLFYFYQLIPLHTQKNVWRLRHDPTYVPNCRTLKESSKICCRVLGFHRLITSEHSTHTPRCSTPTPRLFVSEFPGDHFCRGPFFSGTIFPGTIFPETIFPGTIFPGFNVI